MPQKQHLETINQAYRAKQHSSDVSFENFQKLPVEIRLYIWRYSLEHHRLLEVHIEPSDVIKSRPRGSRRRRPRQRAQKKPRYSTTNSLGNLISGQPSKPIVKSYQLYSKLLRVNHESRGAALRFYRVRLPCSFMAPGVDALAGQRVLDKTLYLNPEYDFIHLCSSSAAQEAVDFLHDLKAYDPQKVGLLNLAIGRNSLFALHRLSEIPDPPAQAAFVDTLAQLENLIWVAEGHAGRKIVPLEGFPGDRVRFNHSMPVKGIPPSFDILGPDPRPVGPELAFVQTPCSDPRGWHLGWQQILDMWGVRPVRPPTERVLFACKPTPVHTISSVEEADLWLENEERSWLSCQEGPSLVYHLIKRYEKKEPPVETPEELAGAVRPAIGFWLFPLHALGSLEGVDQRGMKRVFDFSGHWPELALSRLS